MGKYKMHRKKDLVISGILTAIIGYVTLKSICIGIFRGIVHYNYHINCKNYNDIIRKYEENIDEYVSELKELSFDNDLELIIKIMYDRRGKVKFGEPKIEIANLNRLEFTDNDIIVKCRNLADDFTAIINTYNPDFNAKNIAVYYDKNCYKNSTLANFDEIELVNDVNNQTSNGTSANHMVTLLQPIGKDYKIIVDPTIPSIGIIKKGEIYIISNEDGKGLKWDSEYQFRYLIDYFSVKSDFNPIFDGICEEEFESISNEWNVESQNKALEKVKKM